MRTTVTLTSEAEALVRRMMRERGLTFKEAINAAIVGGLSPTPLESAFRTPTFDLGNARIPLDRAVAVAGELEQDELLRKRSVGK